MIHVLVRWAMIGSAVLAVAAWWMKDTLPSPDKLRAEMLEEPAQAAVRKEFFDTTVNGMKYRIQPRYSYDLHGLVVSLHDADTWWDYAHKQWQDHINVMDLCVVWGVNAQNGVYRKISWKNDQWTCWASSSSREDWSNFEMTAMSNNHMVTDDPYVAKKLRQAKIGDEIRFTGYLSDYATFRDGVNPQPARVSSTVRTDTGNGACETVYIESFEILKSHNKGWRFAQNLALALLLASVLGWAFLPPAPIK